jgi:hypothetical protein
MQCVSRYGGGGRVSETLYHVPVSALGTSVLNDLGRLEAGKAGKPTIILVRSRSINTAMYVF